MSDIKNSILQQLYKQAQMAAQKNQQTVDGNVGSLASKLVSNLISDIGATGGTTSTKPDAKGLFPKDLKNLGDLLTYCANNSIEWQNEPIAAAINTSNPQRPSKMKWEFNNVISTGRDPSSRKMNTSSFFANKEALTGYLDYLRRRAVKTDNKVLEVMVGKLAEQVNQYVDPVDQIKADVKGANGYLADAFLSRGFDVKNPLEGSTELLKTYPVVPDGVFETKLYTKNLISSTTFNAWFYQNVITVLDKDGNQIDTRESGIPSACLFLNSVVQRAEFYAGRAASRQAKDAATMYLADVKKIAAELKCPAPGAIGLDTTVAPGEAVDAFANASIAPNKTVQDKVAANYPKLGGMEPILTLGDLESVDSYMNWFKKSSNGQLPDLCKALRLLHGRAKYYVSIKTSEKFAAVSKAYLKAVEDLAGNLTNAAGESCNLDGVSGGNTDGNVPPGTKDSKDIGNDKDDGSGSKKITPDQGNALLKLGRGLAASMPLEESQIDYERIIDFYQVLENFYNNFSTNTGRAPNTRKEMAVDQLIMRSIRYGNPQGWRDRTYSLSNDPHTTIQSITSFQLSKNFTLPFLAFNKQLVQNVMSDLNSLRSNISGYKGQPLVDNIIAGINNQIGTGTSSSGGVGQRNIFALDSTAQKAKILLGG